MAENKVDYSDLKNSFVSNNSSFDGLYDYYVNKQGMNEKDFANSIIPSLWINGPKTHEWLVNNGYLTEDEYSKAKEAVEKQEEQNKPSVVNDEATDHDGDVTIPEADGSLTPSKPKKELKTEDATKAEGFMNDPNGANKKENLFAKFGKALANAPKKIAESDVYKDYVYGNSIGSVRNKETGDSAKRLKEANAANFLANEYPSLLTSVFSRKSGKNMGQRLAGLGELLATIGGAAANGALAGFHGQTAPAPVTGRQAQMYNNAYMKQNERAQKTFDAANDAEIEYADKYARINKTQYLRNAPQEVKDFAAVALGSQLMEFDSFLEANRKAQIGIAVKQQLEYDKAHTIPFEKLDEKEKSTLQKQWNAEANKKMREYYNDYVNAHSQYEAGLKKQGLVLSNTGTELSNTGAGLSNVYKDLENQAKKITNVEQKQTFISSIRDQINNLRKLKYENIKSQNLDYFAVEKALMDVVTGIYTTSTGSSVGGSAGVNFKAVNASVSGNKSAGAQIDSLANKNIPLAKEAADNFKKLTEGNINEWNKWIDAQIQELEKTLKDVNKESPEVGMAPSDYQSRLGYDGKSSINKDFDYYRQLLG